MEPTPEELGVLVLALYGADAGVDTGRKLSVARGIWLALAPMVLERAAREFERRAAEEPHMQMTQSCYRRVAGELRSLKGAP